MMTEQEMNEAIAKLCEARFFSEDGGAFWHFVTKDGREFGAPTESMDAVHKIRKILFGGGSFPKSEWNRYLSWLGCGGGNSQLEIYGCINAAPVEHVEAILHAFDAYK